jgi:tetratricopeptide (TPR) repeat protein
VGTLVIVSVVVTCLLAPDALGAAPPLTVAAKAHYRAGSAAYNTGDFAKALTSFERAAKLVPGHPLIVLALGQTHRNLGNLKKALFFYKLYISKVPAAKRYADVQKRIAELESKLRAGTLKLAGLQPGAEVLVDGKLRAQAPLASPLALAPGEHGLEVRARGFVAWKRKLVIEPGGSTTLRVQLMPLAQPAPSRSRGWLVAGIATATVAVGAEIAAIVLTTQANDEVDGTDAYTTKRDAAIAMHVVAGAAAVASVVSWVFWAKSGTTPRVRAALLPTRDGLQFSAAVRF